jgi:hypothetical protein
MSSIEQSLNGFADLPMPFKTGPTSDWSRDTDGVKQTLGEQFDSQSRTGPDTFEDIPNILEGLAVRYDWDDFFGT